MKFLLIGFAIAFVIGISIIALAYFSARFKEDEAKRSQSSATKRKLGPVMVIILLVILLIMAIVVIRGIHPKEPTHLFVYKLTAGQKVYTRVTVGQGTNLQLWASKPFCVVADQIVQLADGTAKRESREYWMPDGESSWTGGDPVGLFTLKGETDGTIVKIKIL